MVLFFSLKKKSIYRNCIKDFVNSVRASSPHIPNAGFTDLSPLHICLQNFKTHNFKSWKALNIRQNKTQRLEIRRDQQNSALWRTSPPKWTWYLWWVRKDTGKCSAVATFEIRFIQGWLDLGVGSNPSLSGPCQLLTKVKYNMSDLKPQKEGVKRSVPKRRARGQRRGASPRV